MASNVLQGKLLSVTVNTFVLKCQLDSSVTFNVATEESDPCKPEAGESIASASWSDVSEGARSWTVSVSAKAFANAVKYNQADLIDLFVNGSVEAEVTFATTQVSDYDHDELQVLSGTVIINSLTLNAPAEGEATYDLEMTGKGKPSFVRTPIIT